MTCEQFYTKPSAIADKVANSKKTNPATQKVYGAKECINQDARRKQCTKKGAQQQKLKPPNNYGRVVLNDGAQLGQD